MGQFLLLLVVALTVAAVVFGVTVLVTGGDPGLVPVEPDGRAVPLPGTRPLREADVVGTRFDTAVRGYRMAQVDQALRRAAYDIGYKDELIGVLEAEVEALRDGRVADADALRRAREAALVPAATTTPEADPVDPDGPAVSAVTVSAADDVPAGDGSGAAARADQDGTTAGSDPSISSASSTDSTSTVATGSAADPERG